MKALIIAAAIIMLGLHDCKISSTEFAKISLEAEGRTYSSEMYEYPGGVDPIYPHEFQEGESDFSFAVYRELYSGEDYGCMLALSVDAERKFELNTKYDISSQNKDENASSFIRLYSIGSDGKQEKREYEVTDGWIIFSDYQDHYTQKENNKETTYSGNYLFGEFEFTAVDKTNDRTIIITDGKFENLKAL